MRTARTADADGVLALWVSSRSAAAVSADTRESVERLIARDPDALLVAVDGDEVIGAVIAGWDGWRGNLYRLAVRPDHRRSGMASALVDEAHTRLRAKGARRITALVAGDEEDATGFWRAVGYAHDVEMVRFVRNL